MFSFLTEVKERLKKKDISAFLIGETHNIEEMNELGYETLKVIKKTIKVRHFFDEAPNWDTTDLDGGIFAGTFGEKRKIIKRHKPLPKIGTLRTLRHYKGPISHLMKWKYSLLNPKDLQPVMDTVNNKKKGIVITYTGHAHTVPLGKQYPASLDPWDGPRADYLRKIPVISEELDKLNVPYVTLVMQDKGDNYISSIDSFLITLSKSENKNAEKRTANFKTSFNELVKGINGDSMYHDGKDNWLYLMDGTYTDERRQELVDWYMQVLKNKPLNSRLSKGKFTYNRGVHNKESREGRILFTSQREGCQVKFSNNKISKVEYWKIS